VLQSKNDLLRHIFETEESTKSTMANSSTAHAPGKLSFISVGSKFRSQLTLLMDKLRSTVCSHYCMHADNNKFVFVMKISFVCMLFTLLQIVA